jgi:predicted nucleic acid-binding protein
MKDKQAFWDASAIVPLCLHEDTSTRARQITRKHPQHVVWWGTLAEARSAFARGHRKGILSIKNKEQAIHNLQKLSNSWRVVNPGRKSLDLAVQLFDDYPLRTGDAFQIAAALVWCEEKPRRRVFVCFDDRLATVAEDVGFKVIKA